MSDETGAPAFPASVLLGMARGLRLPHLDDLVGTSNYTSPEKEEMVRQLQAKGFIWMQDCAQCRNDGTWARRERMKELDQRLADIRARVALGELTVEEGIEDLHAAYTEAAAAPKEAE